MGIVGLGNSQCALLGRVHSKGSLPGCKQTKISRRVGNRSLCMESQSLNEKSLVCHVVEMTAESFQKLVSELAPRNHKLGFTVALVLAFLHVQ